MRLSALVAISLLILGTLVVVSFAAPPARADEVVATIPLNYGVTQVAVNPNTNLVYVSDNGGDAITVIDGSTYQVATTIHLPVGPNGFASPDGIAVNPSTGTIYVAIEADANPEDVYVINAATNNVSQIIQLPNEGSGMSPLDVAVDPTTNMVYVTSGFIAAGAGPSAGNLVVINGTTNAVVSNLSVEDVPFGVAVDPSTNMVYVTDAPYAGNTYNLLTVVDGSTNSIVTTITVPNSPQFVAVDSNTDMVYVGEQMGASLAVIDGATNTLVTQIGVRSFPSGIAVDPSTNTVYVDNAKNNSVSVIDGASNQVTTTIPVGISPSGVAVDPNTHLVYVANSGGIYPVVSSVSVIQGGSPGETSFLTVLSKSTNGSAITGVGVSLSIDGRVAVSGMTPDTFALNDGQSAVVQVNNYQNCVFEQWADSGSTNSSRSITINGDTQITALYSCSQKVVSWKSTNGLSEGQGYSLGLSCPTYESVVYCVGDGSYYSTVSSSGFSTWSATTPYPADLDAGGSGPVVSSSCVISSGYIYCIGGQGVGSGAHAISAVEYAPVSASGIGTWTGTTPFPVEVSSAQCLTSQGYIYCISGSSTYYVPILASGGLGAWSQTTSYPSGITGESCATSGSDVYCVAGSTNSTYYATLSSSGISPWIATTNYLGWDQNGLVCTTGESIIYCIGDGTFGGVWYAQISPTGIGDWSRTTSYPTGTPISCLTQGSYIYCVDTSGLPSYFSLISSANSPTALLTVNSQDTSGNPLSGYEAVLNQSGNVIVARGYTPASFNLTEDQSYTVTVDGYGSCTFDRWLDTGNTTAIRQISISSNTELTAVLNCAITTTGTSSSSTTSSSSFYSSSSSSSSSTTSSTSSSSSLSSSTLTTSTTTSSSTTMSTTGPTSATSTAATSPSTTTSTSSGSSQASSTSLSAAYITQVVVVAGVILILALVATRKAKIGAYRQSTA